MVTSTYAENYNKMDSISTPTKSGQQQKMDPNKTDMWSSLLDNVSSGKRLPEKQVIVLGGSSTTQKDFLEALGSESSKNQLDRQKHKPPIANDFALGYTYQEVLDADQEGRLPYVQG
jgi:dynein light intermediate chain 1, cytosolic